MKCKNKVRFLIVIAVSMIGGSALASMSKVSQGYRIVFSVIPSEMLSKHSADHPEREMHGGIPEKPKYHVIVSLFDIKTNKRVKPNSITVTIKTGKKNTYTKKLEPMLLNGIMNYGQYFTLNTSSYNKIDLSISLKNSTKVIKVSFKWSSVLAPEELKNYYKKMVNFQIYN